ITINGRGTLDGNGVVAWRRPCKDINTCKLPPTKVSNAQIQDIKSENSKMFHMSIYESQGVTLNNVTISAPDNSPNTDGVHIARSSDIRIINSQIAMGDDCISIGERSSNVNITGISYGPGHGICVRSLGKNQGERDVSLITVTNCTLTGTTNGVRIKTFASHVSLTAYDLTFQHIIMNNVKNPIIINQQYCPQGFSKVGFFFYLRIQSSVYKL
ncbi:exopolygalacturonase, partial [Phtheirospermum japonicum]